MSYLNLCNLDAKLIATELYDFSKPGALSWTGIVSLDAREKIISAAETLRKEGSCFIVPQRERGRVIQEMEICYLERLKQIPDMINNVVAPLIKEFNNFYRELITHSSPLTNLRETYLFDTLFNSVGIHYYPAGTAGITPHRDFSSSFNIIVIFVLSGDSQLYYCANRQGDNSLPLSSEPGSMILLRAARNEQEQPYRPFHYLTGPSQHRYSLILRQEQGEPGTGYA